MRRSMVDPTQRFSASFLKVATHPFRGQFRTVFAVRKSGTAIPTMAMKSTRSPQARAIHRDD